MAVEKTRKGKSKYEKKKRCNLFREEIEVTEEVRIVRLLYIKVILTFANAFSLVI